MVSQRKVKKNTATILPARVKAIKEYKTTHQKRFNLPFISNFGLAAEKDYLIENLSMLLLSGLDLLSSLDAIQSDIRSKKLKDIVSDLKGNIDAGFSLSQSLIESKLFPEHIISLIRIGEETGKLADNLKVIVIQQQKEILAKYSGVETRYGELSLKVQELQTIVNIRK